MRGRETWRGRVLLLRGALVAVLVLLSTVALSPHLAHDHETAHSHASVAATAQPAAEPGAGVTDGAPAPGAGALDERGDQLSVAHDASGGDHAPGGGHHHYGGEQGMTSLGADVLLHDGQHVTEEVPDGFLGAVRAAGGRERPD